MALINLDHPYLDPEEEIVERTRIHFIVTAHAEGILLGGYSYAKVEKIWDETWQRYDKILPTLSRERKYSPNLMRILRGHTFAMALYQALEADGLEKETAFRYIQAVQWHGYGKMGRRVWENACAMTTDPFQRMLYAAMQLRTLGYEDEAFTWERKEPDFENRIISSKALSCPQAEYYHSNGLAELCVVAACDLDYPLANLWGAELKRTNTIAQVLTGKDEYKDCPMECEFTFVSRQSEPMKEFGYEDVFGRP